MKTQLKYSFSNFIKLLETLILNIGLARVISDITSFGKLQQFFIIVTFLVTISSAFPTSLNYFISRYTTKVLKNNLFKRFFMSMIIMALLSCLIFFLFKYNFFVLFKNDFFVLYIIYFILILFFKIINTFFSNYFLFTNKLNFFNIVSLAFLVIYLLSFFYFGAVPPDVEFILIFFVVYEVVKFMVLCIPFIKSLSCNNFGANIVVNKEELKFVLPTILLVLAGILNMQIDKYMISAMETPEVFAKYQVGAFNIPFIAVITTSFFTIITPQITKSLRENNIVESLKLTQVTIRQASLLLLPIIVFCFFFSTEIIVLLFGERFASSGEVFKIYSLRFLISVFPFSIYMGIIGLKNLASIHVVASAILNIICNMILIPRFGVIGAVYATIIASYATVFIPIFLINKKLSTNLFSYFPIKDFLKTLIISMFILLPFYFTFKKILIGKWVFAIVPIAVIYYLTTIFIIERKQIKNIISKFR